VGQWIDYSNGIRPIIGDTKMKPLRASIKWVIAAFGVLLVLFILKIVLFLTAKPKITVDYVAEYNRTSRPRNYDPNDNAAPNYQKAFDAFVDMPDELRKPYINWPADFNDIEQALLEKWIISNTLAFEYFREALNKPYYWIERESEKDNSVGGMTLPELAQLRKLTETLIWDAKLKTIEGQFQHAFEDVLCCYRAGSHKCRPNLLLMEQHTGLRIKQDAVHGSLVILDRSKADSKALKFLQDNLKKELDKDTYIPGSQAEKLYQYDKLQRTFIDNGKGTGRLWWRIGFDVVMPIAGEDKIYENKIKMSCFTGPTRKQVVEQIEQTSALFNQVMEKTPWQIKDEGQDYFREIDKINKRHFSLKILDIGIIDPTSIFHSYHKTRAQVEALIATLAVFRFKADTDQFPESLNELVSSDYLKAVPRDPYSSGPLVYKRTEDNFKLYSIGKDFSDDGGLIEVVNTSRKMQGFRETPIIPHVHSPDIVYWPVKEFNKLRYEFTVEEVKRLKAEREAETRKRIEEPNQAVQ
jgi:hypothetical protein